MARRKLLAIIVVGFIIRIGYAVAIYEPSLLPYHGGEIELYLIGAKDILSGDLAFTRRLCISFGDRRFFLYLWRRLNLATILAFLAAEYPAGHVALIPLTYFLARQTQTCHKNMALLASLIALHFDPTSIQALQCATSGTPRQFLSGLPPLLA